MQQRSSDTKNKILASASSLFSTAGYDATGVSQICEAAGVSKGAFYHHFPSKHAVFMALLQSWLDALNEDFFSAEISGQSVPDTIRSMTSSTDVIFSDALGQFPLFLEFWGKSIRDERVWEETKKPFLQYFSYFSNLIRKGIQDGAIQEVDPNSASRAIIGLAIGIILQGMLYPQDTDWKQEMQSSMNILLRGLENEQR